jgi:4-hydroxy-2-oxoheptanedioate aldolase
MRESRVLKKLRSNGVALATSVGFTNSSKVTELVGLLGFDCIWIDMEHRPLDYEQVFQMVQGGRAAGTDSIVRVRKESYASYFRAFEDGAAGIMVPHCTSVEEVREIVRNAKYPPQGRRGVDGVGVDADYGLAEHNRYMAHADRETFIAVQVEDKETLEIIDGIAGVPGIDILFVGPGDLSMSLGVSGNTSHPLMGEAVEQVAEAARRCGIAWGIPAASVKDAEKYISMGAQFITVGSDRGILVRGFKELFSNFNGIIGSR